jgi:hypothetical protein
MFSDLRWLVKYPSLWTEWEQNCGWEPNNKQTITHSIQQDGWDVIRALTNEGGNCCKMSRGVFTWIRSKELKWFWLKSGKYWNLRYISEITWCIRLKTKSQLESRGFGLSKTELAQYIHPYLASLTKGISAHTHSHSNFWMICDCIVVLKFHPQTNAIPSAKDLSSLLSIFPVPTLYKTK